MDFHLKQWRDQHDETNSATKLPRLLLDPTHPHHQHQHQHQHQPSDSSALPLFSPEPTTKLSNLSAFPPDSSTRFPRMGSSGGYFSMGQWQELELQALIYRHMLAGASIPPELLHLLVKKSLLSSPPSPRYLPHLQHYPQFQPALLQSGYWGRGAMDPEPGRCRRTDGKKWRCSRDVVAGHKYCERHMHRGRSRSRKPVEIPTPTPTPTTTIPITGGGGGVIKTTNTTSSIGGAQTFAAMADGGTPFALSGSSPSFDLLHLNQRNSESMIENKSLFRSQNDSYEGDKSGGRILRHFFDDWPRSAHEPDTTGSNASTVTSSTGLSMSIPENPSSDFSLKLSTGNGEEPGPREREHLQLNWGAAWGTNQVASMGGPLAEALRSSTSNSSPTSVLYQLQRSSTSEANYITT